MAQNNLTASYSMHLGNWSYVLDGVDNPENDLPLDEFVKLCSTLSAGAKLQLKSQYNISCPEELFPEDEIIKVLYVYVPLILICVGTFGNLFTFMILRSRAMRSQSTYIYLSALAIADTTLLYSGLLPRWLSVILEIHDILGSHKWVCKTMSVVSFTCADFSAWLIVAVTLERYIAVCHPLKASDICNLKKARIAIVTLFTGFLCLNCHLLWTADREEIGVDVNGSPVYHCGHPKPHDTFIKSVWPWIDTTIYSFLPFVIIMILNCMIVRQVVRAQRSRGRLSVSVSTSCNGDRRSLPRSESSGRKLTIMLLTVSFTFLLTTLPLNIVLINTRVWDSESDVAQRKKFNLGRTITELIMYLNHSMNFFLYCASGQKFRSQMVRLLKSFCHKTSQPPHFRRSFSDPSSIRSTKYQVHMDYEMEPNCNYNGKNYNQLCQELSGELTQMTTKGYL